MSKGPSFSWPMWSYASRCRITRSLYLVASYDVGSVDYEKFYHSYGIGVRYTVPLLGKLRLDYGWNTETGSPGGSFLYRRDVLKL